MQISAWAQPKTFNIVPKIQVRVGPLTVIQLIGLLGPPLLGPASDFRIFVKLLSGKLT